MEIDAATRTIRPVNQFGRSTQKRFFFLAYLALKRTDGGDGHVPLGEIVTRVPCWIGDSPKSAGKTIQKFSEQGWWVPCVAYEQVTQGPYRLLPEPRFVPDREAVTKLFAAMPARGSRRGQPRHQYRVASVTPIELQAYDLLMQYGVYIPAVIDLVMQRIGVPERIKDARARLFALRILATLYKNRGKPREARAYAEQGLKLAKRFDMKDDVAYLLDQIGGTYYLEARAQDARKAFEDEISYLREWGTLRAEFHLAGAFRGLTSVLRASGDRDGATAAIAESRRYAERSGNVEALRLAGIEETRLRESSAPARLLAELPSVHLVGRVMAMGTEAERLLDAGSCDDGKELLRSARREAKALGLWHQVAQCNEIARRHGVALDESDR